MRRFVVIVVATALAAPAPFTSASARSSFVVKCRTSHVATVDPIVAPGGRSAHQHEFFGNRSTDADSTYASMLRAGTSCGVREDTAGYWVPTLFRPNGRRVPAVNMAVYYRGAFDGSDVRAFPRNLRIISDHFTTGINGKHGNVRVTFPSCWDGFRIDSADHRSHMAFPRPSGCPASHPVQVPLLIQSVRYPVANVRAFRLSSGPLSTGHADFWNTWDQPALVDLVARCLNGRASCGRIDSATL